MKALRYLTNILTIVLCCGASAVYAQSVQDCRVTQYHGKEAKTALEGVSVTAANAGSVISNAEGKLSLQFRTLKVGDQIQFRRIDMAGYEVMNTEALEAARIARKSDQNPEASTLQIVMAPRQLLRKLRDGYRSVAVQRYEKQLKASEAEVQRLREANKLAEEEYNERMNQLEEEYEEKLSKLETYIDKFARIDLSDLDTYEQQIIDLVQEGQFEEALTLYDKQDLANRLRQSRADQAKLAEASQQIAAAERQKALENQRLRQSIDRQVTLLRMAGGEENMLKVHRILHETFLADTTDWEARRDYAFSLQYYGQAEEQCQVLRDGITTAKDDYARGMITLDLMSALWNNSQHEEAIGYAKMADSLLTPLQEGNATVLTRALPGWTFIQLRYYIIEGDTETCKKLVERAEQQWSPDTLVDKSLLSYTTLLSDMSDYYSHIGNHQKSLWCTQEGLRLGKIIEEKWPWQSNLFEAYANACSTFAYEGKTTEACDAARQSAERLAQRVEKVGTVSAYKDAVICHQTISDALLAIEQYELADSIIQRVAEQQIVERASAKADENTKLFIALYQLNRAQLLLQKKNVQEAETLIHTAIASLEQHEEGSVVAEYLRPMALSRLALAKGLTEEALQQCQEAIQVCQQSYDESQDDWDADNLCRLYLLKAGIYEARAAEKEFKEAIKTAKKYAAFECNKQAIDNKVNNHKSLKK